jgi:mono/diheme cytochrome c family protein
MPPAETDESPHVQMSWPKVAVAALLILLSVPLISAQEKQSASKSGALSSAENQKLVARGRYIVEDVAVCAQCHTPRDSNGVLDRNRWLEGASVWLQPAEHIDNWPLQAPRIAGNPPGTDAEMITLLTTGLWRNGARLRPPMPQFRLTVEDAQGVVAYLKSLSPQP